MWNKGLMVVVERFPTESRKFFYICYGPIQLSYVVLRNIKWMEDIQSHLGRNCDLWTEWLSALPQKHIHK